MCWVWLTDYPCRLGRLAWARLSWGKRVPGAGGCVAGRSGGVLAGPGCGWWWLPDGDVGGAQGVVSGGLVLGGGAVAGAGLEQVGDDDEVVEHGLVGGAVVGRQQGAGAEDFLGLGADDAGVGFEDQGVRDGRRAAFDEQVGGHDADLVVEGDLGLSAA